MKQRYRMFQRCQIFYAEDTTTGKQASLKTKDESEAFIGTARGYALLLRQGILRARASGDAPLRYLINGSPGVGKSQLVKFALCELGVSPWSIISRSGTAVGIEEMQVIEEAVRLRNLFGYRAVVMRKLTKFHRRRRFAGSTFRTSSLPATLCSSPATSAWTISRNASSDAFRSSNSPGPMFNKPGSAGVVRLGAEVAKHCRYFLPEPVTFPWSAAFACRCWNWTTAFC
jgi:hypothetical protein